MTDDDTDLDPADQSEITWLLWWAELTEAQRRIVTRLVHQWEDA